MKRRLNVKLDKESTIVKKISFGITIIIIGTILCSGALMHIIIN